MRNCLASLAIAAFLCACTITQTVDPVTQIDSNEVCIIEDPAVREGFLPELEKVLRDKNATIRRLELSAKRSECPIVVTYTARWSWDLAMYMSYAEIVVYQDGTPAGKALYDATKGGGRMDKFVDAEPKIRELVNELFPGQFPEVQ